METILFVILLIIIIIYLRHIYHHLQRQNKWFQLEEYLQESERIRKEQIHKNKVLKKITLKI